MNTQYIRVILRDLFNEAKLLKCIGRLTLLIHDGNTNGITVEHDDNPFKIGLLDDGYLSIKNITFELNGKILLFKSLYNSKNNYPLVLEYNYCEYTIFDETGNYTTEFIEFCKTIK